MAHLSFQIKTSRDFFQKLKEDHSDFIQDPLSSRYAINCAMTAWHLIEWAYKDLYPTPAVSRTKEKERLDVYRQSLCSLCPDLNYMNDVADGSKHCTLGRDTNIAKTGLTGSFSREFSSEFDIARFVIVIDENSTVDFEDSLERVMQFWETHFTAT